MERYALVKWLLFCLLATSHLTEGADDFEARAYFPAGSGESTLQLESRILQKITSGYNKNLHPHSNSAVENTLSMAIIDIYPDDKDTGFWKVDYAFRQEWNDPRLEYRELLGGHQNYTFLTLTTIAAFWKPDVFLDHAIDSFIHNVIQDNVMVRLFADGNVLFSTRITTTLRCAETRLIGNGEFTCVLTPSSFAHTTEQLTLKWRDQTPVQFQPLLPSGLLLTKVSTQVRQNEVTTGSFPRADAIIVFQRNQCG